MKTSVSSKLSKLMPTLALSLVLGLALNLSLSGRVSAASASVTLTPKPAGTPDPWCAYMEDNYPGLCPSGGTDFSAVDPNNISGSEVQAAWADGENIGYISATAGSGLSLSTPLCSNATLTSLNILTRFDGFSAIDDEAAINFVYFSPDGGTSFSNFDAVQGLRDPQATSYFPSDQVYAALVGNGGSDVTEINIPLNGVSASTLDDAIYYMGFRDIQVPTTTTATLTYDDSACGTTDPTPTPTAYCPSPGDTTQVLTPEGDCDGDGITNQTEGYDPDTDGNPSTGTPSVDTDGDGIPDYLDLDTDNDGILDSIEKGTAQDSSTNPSDTDGDGTPDFRDTDSDNDGMTDLQESGIPNPSTLDTNNDGMIDGGVNQYGIPTAVVDPSDPTKVIAYTIKDTDNDGTPDYLEADPNTKPNKILAETGDNQQIIAILSLVTLSILVAASIKARRFNQVN